MGGSVAWRNKIEIQMAQREEVVVDFEDNHGTSNSKEETSAFNVLRCPHSVSIQGPSWKSQMSRVRSRLVDQPEESCGGSSEPMSLQENDNDDDDDGHKVEDAEDMPQMYKRMMHSAFTALQWVCLASIVAALACNLWVSHLKRLKL